MVSPDIPAVFSSEPRYQVISFGDSLSDVGTYAPAAAHFGGGRFTTNPGEVWTQILARSYGDTLIAAYTGGFGIPVVANPVGFAYGQGGSRIEHPEPFSGNTTLRSAASNTNPNISAKQALRNAHRRARRTKKITGDNGGLIGMPIAAQIENYLQTHHRFTPSQLVLINGGSNDIMANASAAAMGEITFAEAIEAVKTAATQYAKLIQKLYENGAHHLIAVNMPDLGHTPIGITDIETSTVLTQLSLFFNTTMTQSLETNLPADHTIVLIDSFGVMNKILENYQEYGFSISNTAIACKMEQLPLRYQSTLFCSPKIYVEANADQTYMFADGAHPSSRLHAVFAQHIRERFEAHIAQNTHARESAVMAA